MQLHGVSDSEFRLDGGAMFGVVPRVVWERKAPSDESNRIRLTTNCLLVESPGGLVLIDTGIGDKHDLNPGIACARLVEERPGRFRAEPVADTAEPSRREASVKEEHV